MEFSLKVTGGAPPEAGVDGKIDKEGHYRENELQIAGKAEWVEERLQVPLDEGTAVTRFSPQSPKTVFHEGKGADPPSNLNHYSPDCSREVEPCQTSPAQHRNPAKNNEDNESGVDKHRHIRQNEIGHHIPRS